MDHKQLYAIGDVARLLNVQQHRVEYCHRSNKVPSPGRSRAFCARRLAGWELGPANQ